MLKFDKINPNWIIGGAVALFIIYKLRGAFDFGGKLGTLADGLSNPLDALAAVVGIEPKITGGVPLTDNFKYYIELNGGIDKYITEHKAGGFTGQPYNATTDYKKLYQQKTLSIFYRG